MPPACAAASATAFSLLTASGGQGLSTESQPAIRSSFSRLPPRIALSPQAFPRPPASGDFCHFRQIFLRFLRLVAYYPITIHVALIYRQDACHGAIYPIKSSSEV